VDDAFVSWKVAVNLLEAARERFELGRTYLEMGRAAADPAQSRRWLYRAGAVFAPLSTPYWLSLVERELDRAVAAPEAPSVRTAGTLGRRHRAPGLVA